jgi:hypothetical protein
MKYCIPHACVYSGYLCPKCWDGDPHHLRTREECVSDAEWEYFKKWGLIKDG